MNLNSILDYGVGSPGETTRVMTKEFIKLRERAESDDCEICRKLLVARSLIYKNMGLDILNNEMIEKIMSKSQNQLPFIILADIFVTNKVQGNIRVQTLIEYLELVIEIVLKNYNSLVNRRDRLTNVHDINRRFAEFMAEES